MMYGKLGQCSNIYIHLDHLVLLYIKIFFCLARKIWPPAKQKIVMFQSTE